MRAQSILHLTSLLPALVAGLAACSSLFDEGEHRVVGLIDEAGTSFDALVVPDTVRAGIPFTVTVSTFGSSCLRPDGADAQVLGLIANVTPYDVAPPSGSVCTADFRAFPRAVTLTFGAPGDALVRLHGRGFRTSMLTLEEAVFVAP